VADAGAELVKCGVLVLVLVLLDGLEVGAALLASSVLRTSWTKLFRCPGLSGSFGFGVLASCAVVLAGVFVLVLALAIVWVFAGVEASSDLKEEGVGKTSD